MDSIERVRGWTAQSRGDDFIGWIYSNDAAHDVRVSVGDVIVLLQQRDRLAAEVQELREGVSAIGVLERLASQRDAVLELCDKAESFTITYRTALQPEYVTRKLWDIDLDALRRALGVEVDQ